jgi:hypothetical protein
VKVNAYTISVEELKGKRPLGRPGCGCEDTIIMDHREKEGGGGRDGLDGTQDRGQWQVLMNTVMSIWAL